ncbi:hypothetical protein [Aquibaculum sediminis]|uniref:hypothetical protein n=1 Tax=Aquibaculum sediminis TaxID=3231907 RepID=UPI003451E4AB
MWKCNKGIVRRLFIFVALFFVSGTTSAQNANTQDPEPTRIVADSEADEIRFYVDDALAAVLKEDGLHVRESIGLGSTVTVYGTEHFDDVTGNADTAPDTEKDGADAE